MMARSQSRKGKRRTREATYSFQTLKTHYIALMKKPAEAGFFMIGEQRQQLKQVLLSGQVRRSWKRPSYVLVCR